MVHFRINLLYLIDTTPYIADRMLTYTNRLIHDDPKGIRYCVGVKGIYPELQSCDDYNLTQKYACLSVLWARLVLAVLL